MSLPKAYCVKCRSYTGTLKKHTVVLSNNRRALKGVCPKCDSDVFRIMSKKKDATPAKVVPIHSHSPKHSGGVFCVKCKGHVTPLYGKTVALASGRRALKGYCPKCTGEVYRILPGKIKQSVFKNFVQKMFYFGMGMSLGTILIAGGYLIYTHLN